MTSILQIFCMVVFAVMIPVTLLMRDLPRKERWSTVLFCIGSIALIASIGELVTGNLFRWVAHALFLAGGIWSIAVRPNGGRRLLLLLGVFLVGLVAFWYLRFPHNDMGAASEQLITKRGG